MFRRAFIPLIPLLLLTTASCNQASREESPYRPGRVSDAEASSTADSSGTAPSSSAPLPLHTPERKLVGTADIRCRVADVFTATSRLEQAVKAAGGLVTESKLENTITGEHQLPYKPDSIQQVRSYTMTGHLTLRIPVAHLDSILSDIAAGWAFMDSRNIRMEDVTLRYLSNELKNRAMAGKEVPIPVKGKDAVEVSEYNDQREENRINRRVENIGLLDQVTYATLQVDLYQPERVDRLILVRSDILMQPSFGQRARLALDGGWQLLLSFFVLIMQLWPLLIVILFLLLGFRMHRRWPFLLQRNK